MEDLVIRLRKRVNVQSSQDGVPCWMYKEIPLQVEAASEIERLRECAKQTRAALMSLREIVRHRTDLQSMDKVTLGLAGDVLERHAWVDKED